MDSTVKSTKNASGMHPASNYEGNATHHKDASKPDGEACHEDGTLKDVSEITWLHSPSQGEPTTLGEKRRRHGSDSDLDINNLPKTNVSRLF